MQIQKTFLADVPWVYAVSAIEITGKEYFLAASELEGQGSLCLLLDPVSGRKDVIWEAPGGVMSLIPVPGEDGAFLSIEEFYPIFKSEKASIHKTVLKIREDGLDVEKKEIYRLPFTHRITLLQEPDGLYLAAANLCNSKKFVEDWSDPGGVHIGPYQETIQLEQILGGLSKNHGMYTQPTANGDVLWIGAHEGVTRYWREDGTWKCEFVLRDETSDMWIADIDGDGQDEMAVIQGFHGNYARVLKCIDGSWQSIGEIPINFGHVVWAGEVLGSRCLITASRGGDMALSLHKVTSCGGKLQFETQVLEEGVGSTQIAVIHGENSVWICSANHETGTVDLYTVTA